jgi:hypothetical protein
LLQEESQRYSTTAASQPAEKRKKVSGSQVISSELRFYEREKFLPRVLGGLSFILLNRELADIAKQISLLCTSTV